MLKQLCILLTATHTIACPTIETAVNCFYNKADTDHDHKITKHELQHAIYSRLSWLESSAFAVFGGVHRIMNDCDQNKDGILTKEEAFHMQNTCMNSCFKRSKTIQLFHC